MTRTWKSHLLFIGLPVLIVAALIGVQLFGPVPIGMANNNDFPRILGSLRLWPAPPVRDGDPHYLFRYFVDCYVIADPRWNSGVPSSEWLIAALAKKMARLVLPPGTFQLRLMGAIHGAILITAFFIFLDALRSQGWRLRLIATSLLALIWTDLEYVQQLSTAYTDSGAVVALTVLFAIAIHCVLAPKDTSWYWPLSFAFFSTFLIATKTQHQVAVPFFTAFCFWMGWCSRARAARRIWVATPFVLIATAAYILEKTPADYRAAPAFTLVFHKLAVLAPNSKIVLSDCQISACRRKNSENS